MNRILILDTETSGLDATKDRLLEVAYAVYSVAHGLIRATSFVVRAEENEAFEVNGIPVEIIRDDDFAIAPNDAQSIVWKAAQGCDAMVAHNAQFDSKWFRDLGRKWICTQEDVDWPIRSDGMKLAAIHEAHLGFSFRGHRALSDVATIVRLFDWLRANGHNLGAMLVRGLRPKMRIVHRSPYEPDEEIRNAKNRVLKNHRFQWDGVAKEWFRMMPPEDAAGFPFDVKEVA